MASDGIEPKSTNTELGPDIDLSDEAAAHVIEVAGVIKWFDVAKGYGFIVPDNGMADVLLHVTCLRRDGYPDRLRRRSRRLRSAGAAEGPASVPHDFHG